MLRRPEFETRRQMYRLAKRTFRYGVYRSFEIAWLAAAFYLIANAFLSTTTSYSWFWYLCLIGLSVGHSLTLTLHMPWVLLTSAVVGAACFAAALGLIRILGATLDPATVAVVAASGHYLWRGELWTQARALMTVDG